MELEGKPLETIENALVMDKVILLNKPGFWHLRQKRKATKKIIIVWKDSKNLQWQKPNVECRECVQVEATEVGSG